MSIQDEIAASTKFQAVKMELCNKILVGRNSPQSLHKIILLDKNNSFEKCFKLSSAMSHLTIRNKQKSSLKLSNFVFDRIHACAEYTLSYRFTIFEVKSCISRNKKWMCLFVAKNC